MCSFPCVVSCVVLGVFSGVLLKCCFWCCVSCCVRYFSTAFWGPNASAGPPLLPPPPSLSSPSRASLPLGPWAPSTGRREEVRGRCFHFFISPPPPVFFYVFQFHFSFVFWPKIEGLASLGSFCETPTASAKGPGKRRSRGVPGGHGSSRREAGREEEGGVPGGAGRRSSGWSSGGQ